MLLVCPCTQWAKFFAFIGNTHFQTWFTKILMRRKKGNFWKILSILIFQKSWQIKNQIRKSVFIKISKFSHCFALRRAQNSGSSEMAVFYILSNFKQKSGDNLSIFPIFHVELTIRFFPIIASFCRKTRKRYVLSSILQIWQIIKCWIAFVAWQIVNTSVVIKNALSCPESKILDWIFLLFSEYTFSESFYFR